MLVVYNCMLQTVYSKKITHIYGMQDGLNNHPGHSFVLAKSSKHAENNISKVQKCDHASSSNKKKKQK